MRYILTLILVFFAIVFNSFALKPAGTILYPTNNEINVSIQPTIQIADSNWATQVEYLISTDSSFTDTTLHRIIYYDTTYSLNELALGLSFKKDYFLKMRLLDSAQLSDWSSVNKFSTVYKPSITFPLDSSTTHIASDITWKSNVYDIEVQCWKDSSSATDTIIFLVEGNDYTYNFEEEVKFSELIFDYENSYFVRIRQKDSVQGTSDWSDLIYFSIQQSPQLLSPLPNPITIQNIDYLEGSEMTVMDDTREVTNNSVVGSIDGILNINPNGSAEYNIEIWSPPGTNGIKPSLFLNYNSQSSDGIAGFGWNLTGLSAISRTNKTKYIDGEDSELTLDHNDFLSLDGNRLIVTDEGSSQLYGQLGTIYTTRSGDNIRVEHVNGNTGNANGYFKVTDKQGTVSFYGQTVNSRAKLAQTDHTHIKHVISWRLNKVMDIHGNYIEYIYEDSFDGMNLIKEIKYTGNDQEGLLPYASIEFEYAQKSEGTQYLDEVKDQNEFYSNGLLQKNSLVIKNIIIKYENQEAKRYSLEYIFNEVTYLHRIKEYGVEVQSPSQREVKNETAFDYYFSETNVASKILQDVPSVIDDDEYSMHFGDFNGDGIQDRLIIDRNESTINGNNRAVGYLQHGRYFECNENGASNDQYKCTGDITYVSPNTEDPTSQAVLCFDVIDYDYHGSRLYDENIVIADFNNDGKDDLILPILSNWSDELDDWGYGPFFSFDNVDLIIYEGSESQINWVSTYLSIEDRFSKWNTHSVAIMNEHFLPADYTGDGNLELVYQVEYHNTRNKKDQFLYYFDFIDEDGQFKNINQVVTNSYNLKKPLRVDYDTYYDLGTRSQVKADFYTVELISNGKAELLFSQKGNSDDEGVYTIEFDNNGVPYLNQMYVLNSSNPEYDLRNVLFTADFNGDGYTDILFRDDENKDDNKKWYIRYWKGKYFSEKNHLKYSETHGNTSNYNGDRFEISPNDITLGDFNGDGKIDIFTFKIDVEICGFLNICGIYVLGDMYLSEGTLGFKKVSVFNHYKDFHNPSNPYELGIDPGKEFYLFPNKINRLVWDTPFFGSDTYQPITVGDSRLIDLNGDGNSDIYSPHFNTNITPFEKENDAIIMFNPSQHNRHLKTISDGFGNRTRINYSSIAEGSVDGNNEEIFRKEQNPEPSDKLKPLNSGIWVVSEVEKIKSKDSDPIQSVSYSYGKSVFHKELGFLGFKEFFSKSYDEENSVNYSENHQYFKILNDDIKKVFTLVPDKTNILRNDNIISETLYDKRIDFYADDNFFIYDKEIITKDYLNSSMVTMNYIYNSNKNVESEETVISSLVDPNSLDDPIIVKTDLKTITYVSKGLSRGGQDIDNKIETETILTEYFNYDENGNIVVLNNNPPYTITTKYEYKSALDNYMLDKKISFFGEPKAVETIYIYDGFGNATSITLHQTDDITIQDRTETFTMDSKGRFILTRNNGLGISEQSYNEIFGVVEYAEDIQGNYINYEEFDGFGRLKKRSDVFGNEETYIREWYTGIPVLPNSQNILYKTTVGGPNSLDVINYYDSYSNLVRTETEASKDRHTIDNIVQTYEYYPDGRLKIGHKPYFSTDLPSGNYVETVYDSFLRKYKTIDQGRENTVFYNYNNTSRLTKLIASDGKNKEILSNEAGVTILTRDNEDYEVKFQYKNDMKSSFVETIALDNKTNELVTEFDIYGNRVKIYDNDAGEYTSVYNAYGELETQISPNGTETYKYDSFGRIKEIINSEGTIIFNYIASGNGIGQIGTITGPNQGDIKNYTYDNYGRIISKMILIQGEIFNYLYEYENTGLLEYKTFPSGVKVKYIYNTIDDLVDIYRVDNSLNVKLWSFEEQDSYGSITKYKQGDDAIYNHLYFDQYHFPDRIKASSTGWSGPWNLQEWDYDFNSQNGNVLKRRDKLTSQIENFEYDELDRIWKIRDENMQLIYEMKYYNDGSIKEKPDVGDYSYLNSNNTTGDPDFPYHAVKSIQNSAKKLQGHYIESTSFNSVEVIDGDCEYYAEIDYNSSDQRNKMDVYFKGINPAPGTLEYSKYYLEEFELKKYPNGDRKQVTYISSPVGIIATVISEYDANNSSTVENTYLVLSDYLGSVERLTDLNGNPLSNARFSYNIWGELRDPMDWDDSPDKVTLDKFELLERGYTGHEHIDEFTLINMNGRIYDPTISQFIQPDNYIANPEESQSYNRYSYVLNNPLKYTDPSGEWIQFAVMGVIAATQGVVAYNNGGKKAFIRSIGMSISGMAIGAATSAVSSSLFKGMGMTATSITGDIILSKTGAALSGAVSSVTTSALLAGLSGSKYTTSSMIIAGSIGATAGLISYSISQKMYEDALENHISKLNSETSNFSLASDIGAEFKVYTPSQSTKFFKAWEDLNNYLLGNSDAIAIAIGAISAGVYATLDGIQITGDLVLFKVGIKKYGVQNLQGEFVNSTQIQDGFVSSASLLMGKIITMIPFKGWVYGAHKSYTTWTNQLIKRGWTEKQITEAITKGKSFSAINNVNKANTATRYVHPTTGQSVIIDDVTKELLHIGGPGFKY